MRCFRCGLASTVALCGQCVASPPVFDRTVALADYRAPLDRVIHALKYRGELSIARSLGTLLARRLDPITESRPLLTAVPLSAARLRERGFNQALELARPIARRHSIELVPNALVRIRTGQAQAQLDPGARAHNMADAFVAREAAVSGRAVLVVDDVMTTGATLSAIASALKRAGAASVTNLVVARTPLDHVQRCPGPP